MSALDPPALRCAQSWEDLQHLTLRVGDAISCLREMPAQSVQCTITSPPYWGLRDYGNEPSVWAPVRYAPIPGVEPISVPGQSDLQAFPSCAHEWAAWTESHDVRETHIHGKTRTTDRCYGSASRRFDGNHQKHTQGQFCVRCGAWRGCLGLEPSVDLYIGHLVQVFREVRRVMRADGTLWLNLGDSYTGSGKGGNPPDSIHQKQARNRGTRRHAVALDAGVGPKQLLLIPARAALALQADGWTLRQDIVWAKGASYARTWHGNPMPESVRDRPSRAHEMIFLLSPSPRYFYDSVAVKDLSAASVRDSTRKSPNDRPVLRNLRDVWAITTKPYPGAHFATFPPDLVGPMIAAGTPQAGCCPQCGAPWQRVRASREWRPGCACPERPPVPSVVLDPFSGAGTTGLVALANGRSAIGIEANAEYVALSRERIRTCLWTAGYGKRLE